MTPAALPVTVVENVVFILDLSLIVFDDVKQSLRTRKLFRYVDFVEIVLHEINRQEPERVPWSRCEPCVG